MNTNIRHGISLPKGNDSDESTLVLRLPGLGKYSKIVLDFSNETDSSVPDENRMRNDDGTTADAKSFIVTSEETPGDETSDDESSTECVTNRDPLKLHSEESLATGKSLEDESSDDEPTRGYLSNPSRKPGERMNDGGGVLHITSYVRVTSGGGVTSDVGGTLKPNAEGTSESDVGGASESDVGGTSESDVGGTSESDAVGMSASDAVGASESDAGGASNPNDVARLNSSADQLLSNYKNAERRMQKLTDGIGDFLVKAERLLEIFEKRMNEIDAELKNFVTRNELERDSSERLLRELDEDIKAHFRINEIWRETSEKTLKDIASELTDHVRENEDGRKRIEESVRKIAENTDEISRMHTENVQYLYEELKKKEKDLFREIQLPVTLDFIDVIGMLRSILKRARSMDEEAKAKYLDRELKNCLESADGQLSNRRINAFCSDLSDPDNPPRFNNESHAVERGGIVFTNERTLHDTVAESLNPGYEWQYDDVKPPRVIRKETVRIFEHKNKVDFDDLRS